MRYTLAALAAALVLSCAACMSPPDKEMNQARGAINAARAAGADVYAPTEYQTAVASLKRSEDAVAQRDYRQALNFALDSREQAENAARAAADQKAAARSQAERDLHDAQTALDTALARLNAVDAQRGKRRPLGAERQTISEGQASVQEARTAIARGDYAAARTSLHGVTDRLQAAITAIERPIPPTPPRRRR